MRHFPTFPLHLFLANTTFCRLVIHGLLSLKGSNRKPILVIWLLIIVFVFVIFKYNHFLLYSRREVNGCNTNYLISLNNRTFQLE